MNLPKNGRIVVVDNNPVEALPLIASLSKSGHPISFFSGKYDDLPQDCVPGIRILFLDMVLVEGTDSDPVIATAAVKSVLDRILSKNNGPFLSIAWTKVPEYAEELKKYFVERGFHFPIIPLNKIDCKEPGTGDFELDLIYSKITKAIVGYESLGFFTCWENITHDSAMVTVNQIAELEEFTDDWNDKMKFIMLKLAQSYMGKHLNKTNSCKIVTNSLFSLSGAFTDNLHILIGKDECLKNIVLDFSSVDKEDNPEAIGMINSKLHLTEIGDHEPMPGNVYDSHRTQKVHLDELFSDCKKTKYAGVKQEIKQKSRQIVLESTPVCDYAQKKHKAYRLIPGILCPSEFSKHIKNAQFIYRSPIIKYEGSLYNLVFDFRFFTSVSLNALDNSKWLFRIKQELLVDIQSRLSSHVNRPGITALYGDN